MLARGASLVLAAIGAYSAENNRFKWSRLQALGIVMDRLGYNESARCHQDCPLPTVD
jgi:hypothetical protein